MAHCASRKSLAHDDPIALQGLFNCRVWLLPTLDQPAAEAVGLDAEMRARRFRLVATELAA